ncbi:MAG: IS91 family transposase [Candidatus Aminicenantes bacterium]|nr:IS91 family transposase [Candidatus Aminicenantes bacterium]
MHSSADHQHRTARPELELADIFREYADRLTELTGQQARVVRDVTECRTAALGGHIYECDQCEYQEISYNSCRNRHCPKCQRLEQVRWLEAQQERLLPIEYHHVVFTVPDVLHPLFLNNRRQAYNLAFAAVSETLHEVALRPKNLGAKIGFSLVLHTWTQTLLYHFHLYCIVTGGGLHLDGSRWVSAKPGFLFSVRILAKVFRGKLLQKLEKALDCGRIASHDDDPKERLRMAARKNWVVYSKPPFAGPEQVLKYLGRYTQRIAISNERLVSMKDGQVTFRWKDRAHGDKNKIMELDAGEFIRRFLLHVVPKSLMRIRHYGLFANSVTHELIPRCRKFLCVEASNLSDTNDPENRETWQELVHRLTGRDVTLCPNCHTGYLIMKETLPALRLWPPVQPRAP